MRDVDPEALEACNAYHVLTGKAQPAQAIRKIQFNLDVMPTTPTMAQADLELARDPMAYNLFKARLRKLDYDVIILDTPPALCGALTAALLVADIVLSPIALTRWTLQGFGLLDYQIGRIEEAEGRRPKLYAIPSIVTDGEAEKLIELSSWPLTQTVISKSAAIRNAGTTGTNLKDNSKAWLQYNDLARELIP